SRSKRQPPLLESAQIGKSHEVPRRRHVGESSRGWTDGRRLRSVLLQENALRRWVGACVCARTKISEPTGESLDRSNHGKYLLSARALRETLRAIWPSAGKSITAGFGKSEGRHHRIGWAQSHENRRKVG